MLKYYKYVEGLTNAPLMCGSSQVLSYMALIFYITKQQKEQMKELLSRYVTNL